MKNLENYGVQSLSAQEIRETDGGQIDPQGLLDVWEWAFAEISALDWGIVFDEDPNMGIPISA